MIFPLLGTEFHANYVKLGKPREEYCRKMNNGLQEMKE